MADNKKYYYLKLKEDFFESDDLKILQSIKDGYLYSDILLKLYLKSLRQEGRLMYRGIIPYTPEMIASVTNHNVGVVEKAMEIFSNMGLIEILDNGAIYMTDLQNFIGRSSSEADRIREYRNSIKQEKQKVLEDLGVTNVITDVITNDVQMYENCTENVQKCTPENRDKSIEYRDKSIDINNINNINNSISARSLKKDEQNTESPVITLMLNTGAEHCIYQKDVDMWNEIYPVVDVMNELRKMKGWLHGNPKRRKTKSGINRFINNWLAKEQDKGGARQPNRSNASDYHERLEELVRENRSDVDG